MPRHRGEAVEEMVLRAEDDRGPHDHRARGRVADARLALRLGAQIADGGGLVGADRRDVHDVGDAGRPRRLADGARPEGLHRVKGLAARLGQDADEVHHGVGALHRAVDRPAIAQVRLDRLDLPDRAERLQMAGKVRPAHADADAMAALAPAPARHSGR